MQKQKIYLKIGTTLLVFGLILSKFYRPYIYKNKINDFGFSDTIGSLISVLVYCMIIWGLKDYSNSEKNKQIILATFIFAFLWEFFGYINIYGTFDIKDVFAGLLSGVVTYYVKNIVERKT